MNLSCIWSVLHVGRMAQIYKAGNLSWSLPWNLDRSKGAIVGQLMGADLPQDSSKGEDVRGGAAYATYQLLWRGPQE